MSVFHNPKPMIGMVHLQYKGDVDRLKAEALIDVKRLERGGIDGLLVENWFPKDFTTRFIDRKTRGWVKEALDAVMASAIVPVGLNILPMDYVSAMSLGKEAGVRFIQLDTFVDAVKTDYENRFVIRVMPDEVRAWRRKLGAENIKLFVNVQTKHYVTLPVNKKFETSARQAILNGADTIIVTGSLTGKETPIWKIKAVKRVVKDLHSKVEVYIGSGLSEENVRTQLEIADGGIVGSSLKEGIQTEEGVFPLVSEKKTKSLMQIVRSLRNG